MSFYSKNGQLSCLPGTSILFIFTLKHLRLAVAIFILYSYCGNDVIACGFTSEQHPYLTNIFMLAVCMWDQACNQACMWDQACNQGPASIGTCESDPRPVRGAQCLSRARLLSEVIETMQKTMTITQNTFRLHVLNVLLRLTVQMSSRRPIGTHSGLSNCAKPHSHDPQVNSSASSVLWHADCSIRWTSKP